MRLLIDTSDNRKTVVGLGEKLSIMESNSGQAQEVLGLLDKIALESGTKLRADISMVEVKEGPGSFTGLRVGVAVANVFGFVLGVPVNGRNVVEEGPVEPKYQ